MRDGDAEAEVVVAGAEGSWTIAGIRLDGADLAMLIAVPVLAGALALFLGATHTGRAVRAAESNPDKARLTGINPKLVSTGVWGAADALAGITAILVAGTTGNVTSLDRLGSNQHGRCPTVVRYAWQHHARQPPGCDAAWPTRLDLNQRPPCTRSTLHRQSGYFFMPTCDRSMLRARSFLNGGKNMEVNLRMSPWRWTPLGLEKAL